MTENEILEMEVGPELDSLVATEVMGYVVEKEIVVLGWQKGLPSITRYQYCILDDEGKKQYALGEMSHGVVTITVPEYSTQIWAAWLVVEKMNELYGSVAMCLYPDGEVVCFVLQNEEGNWKVGVQGKSTPEAICKAALLAKEKK